MGTPFFNFKNLTVFFIHESVVTLSWIGIDIDSDFHHNLESGDINPQLVKP